MLKSVLRVVLWLTIFIVLTFFTQVGGLIFLLWLLVYFKGLKKLFPEEWKSVLSVLGFAGFYMIFNLLIIPLIASAFNRVPLPFSKSGNLIPVTYWTCIFNRHYITREGKESLLTLSDGFVAQYPECKVKYMDCNFPFRFIESKNGNTSGIPFVEGLFPHFSHVGNKADVALVYHDETNKLVTETPTAIGYGSSVNPLPGESCMPCKCDKKNAFYSFMFRNLPHDDAIQLDVDKSSKLVRHFLTAPQVRYTLLEQHLRERFRLKRFHFASHGCKTVRHDDHFHIELR